MTTLIEVSCDDGTKLRGLLDIATDARTIVLVVPGFGRTAIDHAAIAASLTKNGLNVLRIDARDHVGLSEGTIRDFSMSRLLEDVGLMVNYARAALGFSQVALFASSLATRACLRALANGIDVQAFVAVAPVISLRDTLSRVTGSDLIARVLRDSALHELEVLDHLVARSFIIDALELNWCTDAQFQDELKRADRCPTLFVQGKQDPWIDCARTTELLAARANSKVIILADAIHQLNLANLRVALTHIIAFLCEELQGCAPAPIAHYSFRELVLKTKADRLVISAAQPSHAVPSAALDCR